MPTDDGDTDRARVVLARRRCCEGPKSVVTGHSSFFFTF